MVKIEDLKEGTKDAMYNDNTINDFVDYTEIIDYTGGNIDEILRNITLNKATTNDVILEWLKNDLHNLYYCNDAIEQGANDIFDILDTAYKNYFIQDAIDGKANILYFYTLDFIENDLKIAEITENDAIYFETFDFENYETLEDLQKEIKEYFKGKTQNIINDLKEIIKKYEN